MEIKKWAAAALMIPSIASAEFFSGNDLLKRLNGDNIEKMQALGFVQGVFDVYVDVTICPPNNGRQVTAGQINDMVRNYLENSPAIRHRTAQSIINEALSGAWPCKKRNGGTQL